MKASRSENAETTSRALGNRLSLFLMILLLMLLLILLPLLLLLLLPVARKSASRGRMLQRICRVKIIWCVRSSISICVMKNPVQLLKDLWKGLRGPFEDPGIEKSFICFVDWPFKLFSRPFKGLSHENVKEFSVIDLYGDQGFIGLTWSGDIALLIWTPGLYRVYMEFIGDGLVSLIGPS